MHATQSRALRSHLLVARLMRIALLGIGRPCRWFVAPCSASHNRALRRTRVPVLTMEGRCVSRGSRRRNAIRVGVTVVGRREAARGVSRL